MSKNDSGAACVISVNCCSRRDGCINGDSFNIRHCGFHAGIDARIKHLGLGTVLTCAHGGDMDAANKDLRISTTHMPACCCCGVGSRSKECLLGSMLARFGPLKTLRTNNHGGCHGGCLGTGIGTRFQLVSKLGLHKILNTSIVGSVHSAHGLNMSCCLGRRTARPHPIGSASCQADG